MAEGGDYKLALASARAELLEGEGPGRGSVPDYVAASWRRSLDVGVSPNQLEHQNAMELDLGSRIARCAHPVISQLSEQLTDLPLCVVLTDDKARIVVRKDSTQGISKILDRVYFAQGFDYGEGTVGTNGIGTVLEFGAAIQIVGAEHFVESLQAFACTAAPVRDPFTGRIEGVLDITSLQDQYSPIMSSLVRAAARSIERNLVRDRNLAQQALFDDYTRVESRTREAVVAVGSRMTMANTAMETLLSSSDQAALTGHMRFLLEHRPLSIDERVDLPSGTPVRLRGNVTEFGHDVAGLVGVIMKCPDSTTPDALSVVDRPRSITPAGDATGAPQVPESRSPAWCAATERVEGAVRAERPVVVLGENGSGRFTLVSTVFRTLNATPRVIALDASEVNVDRQAARALLMTPAQVPTLVVLRDLDRLTSEAGAALLEVVGERLGSMVYLAATATTGGIQQPLMATFDESVTVPPLRHRTVDVSGLAHSILHDLSPNARVRLSDEVLRLLNRHRWPGNVRELREVIASALSRRPVGTIQVDDLPAYCQSIPRTTLREVDKVERDAIVAALREAGGNRKAAAVALGFARSTLYRKIGQYGIVD